MTCFYYFLEGETKSSIVGPASDGSGGQVRIPEPDLAAALADCTRPYEDVLVFEGRGPKSDGVFLYPKSHPGDVPDLLGWDATKQTWMQGVGRHWIGWLTGAPPSVDELRRNKQFDAWWGPVDDADQQWLIPTIRSPDDSHISMPMDVVFDADGNSTMRHKTVHQELWEFAGEITDHMSGVRVRSLEWERLAAVRLLGINFRLAKTEVNALQEAGHSLLTSETIGLILGAACDLPLLSEHQKKKRETMPPAVDLLNATPG